MMGDETKWVSGVIHPGVSANGLLQNWKNQPEAGNWPDGELITDGRTFKIRYRTTWQLSALKPFFLMVVQQVANLEAKPEIRIEWS